LVKLFFKKVEPELITEIFGQAFYRNFWSSFFLKSLSQSLLKGDFTQSA
jgi:hypothetical protein